MSRNYECSVNDLFDLFADALDPSDVLTSKLMSQISTAIMRERIKLRMSQSEFSKHIGASQSLISKWEHGDYNFSIRKLADIATRLGIDVNINITPQNIGEYYSSASFSHAKTICFSERAEPSRQKTYTVNQYQGGY